jgi:outer membrane protein assembly factor BamB
VPTNAWGTYAYNATTGKYLWNYTTPDGGGLIGSVTPAYFNNKLYLQDDFFATCIDATPTGNGTAQWRLYGGHSVLGGISYANSKVNFATELKAIYVADASTGQKLGYFELDSFCWSNPAFYSGMMYWGTLGQKVYCFEDLPYGTAYNYPFVNAALSKSPLNLGESVSITGAVTPAVPGMQLTIYIVDPTAITTASQPPPKQTAPSQQPTRHQCQAPTASQQ